MISISYVYDGSFEGLLTVIFEIYELKRAPSEICPAARFEPGMFGEHEYITTIKEKADRVAAKIKLIDKTLFRNLLKVFLSERDDREMIIYRVVKLALKDKGSATADFRNADVLKVKEIVKQINREVHRMHAFVRFQRLADDIWFAAIEPDFDVLPLTGSHFKKRYADQLWIIYDVRRKYGLYYDLEEMNFITLPAFENLDASRLSRNLLHDDEVSYQKLWKAYFNSVNIKERNNKKLHVQHVPKRYWKYLFEK